MAGTAEFEELRENEIDRAPDTLIGLFLEPPVLIFDKADRTVRNEFAASGLLDAGFAGPLAKQVEFVLMERSLESQKQPIIAEARRIYRLLIDEQRVDNPAHLHQLLPLAAVTREARDLTRADRTHFAETHLRYHALKPSARDASPRRTAEIFIDDLHLAPAQRLQMGFHSVLQLLAFNIIHHLVLRDANWSARPNTDQQLRQKPNHFDARRLGEIAPARYGESFAEQRQLCDPSCS